MKKNHYKMIWLESNSHRQEGETVFEGDFESFEEFMKACEDFDRAGCKKPKQFGITYKQKLPRGFHYAGGFFTEYSAYENGVEIPRNTIDSLIW